MATMTLLEMVQHILSSMDSDEVNDISDTTESLQVANVIRGSYYDLITDLDLPEHRTLFELTASGDSAKPTLMTIPSTIKAIDWIKYNTKADADTAGNYRTIQQISVEDLITMMQHFREESTSLIGVQNITNNSETFDFIYRKDQDPHYYCVLDDFSLVFDSLDTTKDTTLQKSKTMCRGKMEPTWTMSNSFTPDINTQQFSLLLNRAKAKAFVELKQAENSDATRETRRQRVINQYQKQKAARVPAVYTAPRYGKS